METVRKQNLRDDIMSDCRSFGSNYHPCSQSRKMSIGVGVDSSAKTRPNNVREDVVVVPTTGNLTSSKGNSVEDRQKKEKVRDPRIGKHSEARKQETSPWVSTRSHQKIPSSEAVHNVKPASSLPATSTMLKQRQRSNDANDARGTYSVQFIANQMSILQSDDEKKRKFDRVTYRRKGRGDASATRVEEFSFATALEVIVPDKVVAEDKTENMENKGNESLRMKLWEVLGTVSSPNKQCSTSQALETGTDNLEPEGKSDEKGNPVVKPRQNSDTIESDSDSHNHTLRRPVTRSLTRKRSPTKVQQNKMKNASSSSYKQKHQENTIFSFEEGWSRRLSAAVNGASSICKRKKSERESSRIEPQLCIPEQDNAYETQQAADRSKTKTPAEKSSLYGNRMGRFYSFTSKDSKDSHQSPVMEMTDKLQDLDGPTLQEKVDQHENIANPSLKSILDPQFDFHSPTLDMEKPIKISSPGYSPKNNQGEPDVHSPLERVLSMEGIRSFKSLLTSKPDNKKNEQTESSDDAGEHEDSPVAKSVPIMKVNHKENRPFKSSSEESDSESSEEGSPIEGPCETETPSPEFGTAQKPEFLFHPTKRRRVHKGVEVTGFSPTSTSPKGTEEINVLPSELNQEDELASAVALFAMALERVKRKMKAMTSKRSADILMSVSEEIHLQLQSAESQIQTDVGKLTSIGKSKRKRLETNFQEQQEQLKVIYERFRDEVNQHLQDCRSTLEGMEAHQIEFKGTVEKQKASHRKLLLQAEEAIETQLNDAQRRITAVHKSAREKMFQLKYVIAECFKEDLLC